MDPILQKCHARPSPVRIIVQTGGETQEARHVGPTTAQMDVTLMLVVLGLAALVALSVHLARALQPSRPSLPDDDCPPPGLSRLLPVGRQVDLECRTGLAALEMWLRTSRVRP